MGYDNLSIMDANVQSKLLAWLENSCMVFIERHYHLNVELWTKQL
jgi:hypothetical protein